MSRLFRQEMEVNGIPHAKASLFWPQTNGRVERPNRTIVDTLYAYVHAIHTN